MQQKYGAWQYFWVISSSFITFGTE